MGLQRYIFMKMLYHENTPETYEPPGFKDHDCVAHFPRRPFAMYALHTHFVSWPGSSPTFFQILLSLNAHAYG